MPSTLPVKHSILDEDALGSWLVSRYALRGAASCRFFRQSMSSVYLVEAAGGFPGSDAGLAGEPLTGFAVLELEGQDTQNVALQGRVVNSHASPSEVSVFGFEPQPVSAK